MANKKYSVQFDVKTDHKGVLSAFKSIDKSLQDLNASQREGLKKINEYRRTIKKAKEFKTLKAQVDKKREAFDKNTKAVAALSKKMKETSAPSRELSRRFKDSKRAAKLAKEEYLKTREALHKASSAIQDAGMNLKHLDHHSRLAESGIKRVNTALKGQKEVIDKVRRSQTHLNKARSRRDKALERGAHVAMTLQGAERFRSPSNMAMMQTSMDFEKIMSEIESKALGVRFRGSDEKSRQRRKRLMLPIREEIRRVAGDSSFNLVYTGRAAKAFAEKGFSVSEITKTLSSTMNLAKAGNLEPEEAASIAAGAANMFGLLDAKGGKKADVAKQMAYVSDVLAYTASTASTDVRNLGDAFKNTGAIANQFGLKMSDVASILSLLSKVNLVGPEAGTGTKMLLMGLFSDKSEVKNILDSLGIKRSHNGKLRDTLDILVDLAKATKNWDEIAKQSFLKKMVGEDSSAITAVNKLLSNVLKDQYVDEIKKENKMNSLMLERKNTQERAAGVSEVIRSIMEDNLISSQEKYNSSVDNLADTLSQDVLPIYGKMYDVLGSIIGRIDEIAKKNQGASQAIGLSSAGLSSLGGFAADHADTAVSAYAAYQFAKFAKEKREAARLARGAASASKGSSLLARGAKGAFKMMRSPAALLGAAYAGGMYLGSAYNAPDSEGRRPVNEKIRRFFGETGLKSQLEQLDVRRQSQANDVKISVPVTINNYSTEARGFDERAIGEAVKNSLSPVIKRDTFLFDED